MSSLTNGNGNSSHDHHDHEDNHDPDFKLEYGDLPLGDLYADDKMRRMVVDLQRHWLTEYHSSRQKLLEDVTKVLHDDFRSDNEKIKEDLMQQFKQELEATKSELEVKHEDILQQELEKLQDRQKKELASVKKKQWCWNCDKEAMYHCCWNTAYCSVECQQSHWSTHRKFCRRKKANANAQARANSSMNSQEPMDQ